MLVNVSLNDTSSVVLVNWAKWQSGKVRKTKITVNIVIYLKKDNKKSVRNICNTKNYDN